MTTRKSKTPRVSRPYAALAAGYDLVMTHIDYDAWAHYIRELIEASSTGRAPIPTGATLLELGCGTGSIGLALASACNLRYVGLDSSREMLDVARKKGESLGVNCMWIHADYRSFSLTDKADLALLLYDGLNYTLRPSELRGLFENVREALRPGGLFLFDQSTPANSENNGEQFEDQGGGDGFRYVRSSEYDRQTRLHTTVFVIDRLGTLFEEVHVQRAYEADEVGPIVREAGFEILASYDGFTSKPVSGASERIQWVARRL